MDQAWAIRKAREVGVQAPEIVASDRSLRWVVMKRLPGIAIDGEFLNWQGCPYDEREFGLVLARIHSIVPHGYGPVDDEGNALFRTWQEFLVEASVSAIETCQDRGALPLSLSQRLRERWIPGLKSAEIPRPSLLHMESLGFANIMYDPESRRITGLLDYEDCIGGDPLFEIAWMKYYFGDNAPIQPFFDFDRFELGYGPLQLDRDRMTLYRPFTYLDKLRWIDPSSSRAQSYLEKLAQVV
jgi:aminoglycoside phosphotransferase (APT) family kinase protein